MPSEAVAPTPSMFGLRAASRLMLEVIPPWTQDLGLLIEAVEAWRPAGASPDWYPGAVLRLQANQIAAVGRWHPHSQALAQLLHRRGQRDGVPFGGRAHVGVLQLVTGEVQVGFLRRASAGGR